MTCTQAAPATGLLFGLYTAAVVAQTQATLHTVTVVLAGYEMMFGCPGWLLVPYQQAAVIL